MASMMTEPHEFLAAAMVGAAIADGPERSSLAGLLVSGERPVVATSGPSGASLFTSRRVLIAQNVGILSKRLSVIAIRRDTIFAYAIDPDSMVSLQLLGAFGQATILFDGGFDPMQLSPWLGETLAGTLNQDDR